MSTFQLIIIALAFVYVISSLYFSISGRILARKREKRKMKDVKNSWILKTRLKFSQTELVQSPQRMTDLIQLSEVGLLRQMTTKFNLMQP